MENPGVGGMMPDTTTINTELRIVIIIISMIIIVDSEFSLHSKRDWKAVALKTIGK